MSVPGEADATFTKRLDYDPRPERVAETEWKEQQEETCISCFGGQLPELPEEQPGRIGAITHLTQLLHNAQVTRTE